MSDFYEIITTVEPEISSSGVLKLYDIFVPLLGLFIISFNLLVVISSGLLLKKRQQPRSTYLFLGNVGLSDLLTGVAVLFGHFYPRHIRSDMSCAIHLGMIVSSTLVSMLSVLLVAVDRFLYILYGLQYQRYIFPNRSRILIVTTWILGIIVGFLPAATPALRGNISGEQCWYISLNPEYVLATTIFGIIPVLAVLVLYGIILCKALKKVSELKKATSGPKGTETANNLRYFRGSTANLSQLQETTIPLRQQSNVSSSCWCWKSKSSSDETENSTVASPPSKRQPSKWRAIKIVLFTTGSFVVTWVPYFVASTMFVYCDHENNPDFCNGLKVAIASPLAILGFSNSLLNPIIYVWWHNGFRTNAIQIFSKRFQQISCCRRCLNKSDNDFASPRTANFSSSPPTDSSTMTNSSNVAVTASPDASHFYQEKITN